MILSLIYQTQKTHKMTTTNIQPYILWNCSDRNHWEISFRGTLEECEKEMAILTDESGYGYEIHSNKIKDSWNNPIDGIHYDTYSDDSVDSRLMTEEEIIKESL